MIQSVGEYSHGENSICIHFLPGIPLELLGVAIANTGSELRGLCACRNHPYLLPWEEIYWNIFCLIVHPPPPFPAHGGISCCCGGSLIWVNSLTKLHKTIGKQSTALGRILPA